MHEKKLRGAKKVMSKERVFEATTGDGKAVIVKFSKSYGIDAHNLLANKLLAPAILSCETISGGWTAVVMEKVECVSLPSSLNDATKASLEDYMRLTMFMVIYDVKIY